MAHNNLDEDDDDHNSGFFYWGDSDLGRKLLNWHALAPAPLDDA